MTRLLIVRHGQSVANLDGIFAGHIDPELTELGLKQAECTAEFIAENYRVDAVYSSDLRRAYKTGLCVAQRLGLPIQTNTGLREIFAGEWEGRRFDDLQEENSPAYQAWRQDIGHAKCPGGEDLPTLAARVWAAVQAIAEANEGKTVVLALHATPIRTLQWHVSGQDLGYMQQIPWVSNASVSEFVYENGTMRPVKVSLDAHLAEMKTELPSNI